jgi:hypothetical protein
MDGKPNEENPEAILSALHGDPKDKTTEEDIYNMNDETM